MDKAREVAEELKEMIEQGMNRKIIRNYDLLMGSIELREGNYSKAIEALIRAISLLPFQSSNWFDNHALFINSLALAYYMAGDLEQAQEEFKKIIDGKYLGIK